MTILLLGLGMALLVAGAEALVRGASRLALTVGLSRLVVGLTVVAFGTSTPELAVSAGAAMRGEADIALGNVVGSNIFNVLFILGVSALVAPLAVGAELVRRQVPLMIAASLALLFVAFDGRIGPWEGTLLAAGIVAYTSWLVASGVDSGDEAAAPAGRPLLDAALIVAGLSLLVFGSRWVVESARELALAWGVPELVVGLTLVAAGTSLPELATSVVATLRGERDIAIGNVVGSNIFNALGIVGVSAVLSPGGLAASPRVLAVDMPLMVVVAIVCLPVFVTGRRVSRGEGALFLAGYLAYTAWVVRAAVS